MFNKPLQQKCGRQRKLNYTSISNQYSAWRIVKVEFMVKTPELWSRHRVCHVSSIQFGTITYRFYVVWCEAN